jgi:hypothetical protein
MSVLTLIDKIREEAQKLESKVKYLESQAEQDAALCDMLAGILDRTALALRGPPPEGGLWSWHNLPELVTQMKADRDAAAERWQHWQQEYLDCVKALEAAEKQLEESKDA